MGPVVHPRCLAAVSWAILACLLLAPRAARAQRIQTIARVIATSDVGGRFAHPVCDRADDLRPSDHAAFTYALTRNAADPDDPLVVDMGGLLSPHGVARYAAQHRPSSLAVMVEQLGYDALAFGLDDLAAPRDGVLALARELRERDIPMVASNLRCGPEAAALCEVLVDASDGVSMHLVNGRRTAVLSVLRPEVTQRVAPDRAAGIAFDAPEASIARLTRLARSRGAELVVAVVDASVEGGPVGFASRLPEDGRPNLLLVSGDDELLFARPSTVQPVLAGTPPNDAVEVRIRESEEIRDGYEMLAQPLEGRGITVGEPVLDWIARIGADYCDAWGRPLAGGHLDETMDVDAMLALTARVLRDAAGADVAVLDRSALDTRWRPARDGSLTASDVYIALEFDEPLRRAGVDEGWLRALAQRAQANEGLATPGLTWTGSGASTQVKVGGHPTESRASYSVVTIRTLAAGGADALPALPAGREWRSLEDATLRSLVLDFLEEVRADDPRRALDDPRETVEWIFRADVNLTFSGATIDNPRRRCPYDPADPPPREMGDPPLEPCDAEGFLLNAEGGRVAAYSTSQLSQADVLTFGLQVDLSANAAAPDWTWQNALNLLYRTAWTEPTGDEANDFTEASDYIRFRSGLSWRGLREPDEDQWYVPDPTVELFVESEFTSPDDRDWHWLLTRPTLGLRFQLLDKLQLQLIGGLQLQPFEPGMEVEAGAGATLTLTPWDFLKVEQRYARLAFTFDYFWTRDVGFEDEQRALSVNHDRGTLRGTLDASFDLAGPLALVVNFNLIVQHEDEQALGASLSATAGIRVGTLARAVGP
ncbi:MAG TPA: hypothetical protein RMH99_23730 [Sandaracinaceae bacterium LLY-WYZ-13_1]|nr:hypothetical protein [Sandaracinaceae bacterium LLY-WYZ-13_1]